MGLQGWRRKRIVGCVVGEGILGGVGVGARPHDI